ncbi:efflux RND transporter periplasmic adaptor subunit [Robiginitalea sp. M366]|uniref:efflux RND transporter periplasmic adaptor subunit n=1 Tax=Robiginitalea aestuariiviva TaxID=3036903 RepID=UPI00240E81EE|nr:efflux RND transporter periplasmic adaptor subunit [Robiginitalea aestuariiviva]MDG1571297.1 efflux RND transporter periplasmic adaptor subunit [Robiginitalea aestuariiviva]
MKRTAILISLSLSILLASCGGQGEQSLDTLLASGNLDAIKARKKELVAQQNSLSETIAQLDSAIEARGEKSNVPLVSTHQVSPSVFRHFLDLQGDVQTRQNVLLYPEMPGTLERVLVKEGDRVRKGQVLARIDDGGLSSQLEQLRTQAALAKTTFERQQRLWEQQIGSEIQYLQAKTQYEAGVSAVRQAEAQLAKASIRATFNGIVDEVLLEEGSTVNPAAGMAVFRLVNLSDMYVEVDVPERFLSSVQVGKDVQIYLPVLGDTIRTQIRQTGNFINPANRSFRAEIPVPNPDGRVKPNLTAKVRINDYTKEGALVIPPSVISENAEGEQYVYLATGAAEGGLATAVKRVVETGLVQGNQVEVLNGIDAGEVLIIEGARRVRDGQQIQILQ